MVKQPLDFELAVSPQGEDTMLEGLDDFLDRSEVRLTSTVRNRRVLRCDDDTVCALADRINDVVAAVDLERSVDDLIRVRLLARVRVRQLGDLVFLFVVFS